ncbi:MULTISPECIES: helix-turn-helix domain-containing protein [Orbaceae]|jgi:predicted transcriptional regulator|uniref:XRE family transcriptional regulator n=1 Tax=Candidatus Schmidhempelia bombi str. Bimp TaxID=1387197 RepID=A0AB94IAA4_9GAMM|nr:MULTISPECIES: helix-turn-helix transcriptional regulator [Orbaceae]OCG32932.1 DNA-binding protein [Gilliamella apicola]TEA26311.1 XRE family transcriptional regulator [Candidatus Schmidhempelia bombi str. Bimp]
MALTEFGKVVRKARIDTGYTLLTMSKELKTTPAYLSGLETGLKKIPKNWVEKIEDFFKSKNHEIVNLQALADVSNETVTISDLPLQQQMLIAGFARSPFTAEELRRFADLLETINKNKE